MARIALSVLGGFAVLAFAYGCFLVDAYAPEWLFNLIMAAVLVGIGSVAAYLLLMAFSALRRSSPRD
jgi:hypothetical protein